MTLVLGWYIPSEGSYGTTVAAYQQEIADAINSGIDGFIVDMFGWTSVVGGYNYKTGIANLFSAVAGTNFKLCFAVDWQNRDPATDAGNMMSLYYNNPNYLTYNGRPVLSGFETTISQTIGSADNIFWSSVITSVKNAGVTNVFFAPVFYLSGLVSNPSSNGAQANTNASFLNNFKSGWMPGLVNGLIGWGNLFPALVAENNAGNLYVANNMTGANSVLAVPSVSSWFGILRFLSSGANTESIEYNGYEGMYSLWQNAIAQAPPFIVLTTWNDYTESYIAPATPAQLATVDVSGWQVTSDYFTSHAGYSAFNKLMYDQLNNGYIANNQDRIFISYRQGFQNLVPSNTSNSEIVRFNPQTYANTLDVFYVTTVLTSNAVLTVENNGTPISTINVASGLVHSRIPLANGTPSFSLIRAANTIFNITGNPVYASMPKYYNVNPVTYFAQTAYANSSSNGSSNSSSNGSSNSSSNGSSNSSSNGSSNSSSNGSSNSSSNGSSNSSSNGSSNSSSNGSSNGSSNSSSNGSSNSSSNGSSNSSSNGSSNSSSNGSSNSSSNGSSNSSSNGSSNSSSNGSSNSSSNGSSNSSSNGSSNSSSNGSSNSSSNGSSNSVIIRKKAVYTNSSIQKMLSVGIASKEKSF